MTTPRTVWEAFYGLYSRPFSLTPDLRFEYHSQSHTTAVHDVTEALQRREGLIVVTGQVGTGKTMLCRTLLANIEKRTFQCVILDPLISAEELILQVLGDFGLLTENDPARREPMTDVTRHRLVTTLQQFLASLVPLNAHAVLLIDEAQHCNPQVLEEIRLLSNFETDEAKLLQIVLVGQPTLDRMLERPELRQLKQRVARRCELHPLTQGEVRDYVERRLAVASERPPDEPADADARSGPAEFNEEAMAAVAAISRGVPRVINTLCDRALQSAFEREIPVVDRRAVLAGAHHLKLSIPARAQRPRVAMLVAAAILALIAAGGGVWWWMHRGANPAASPAVTTPPVANAPASSPPAATTEPTPPPAAPDNAPATPAPAPTGPAANTLASPQANTPSAQTAAPSSGSATPAATAAAPPVPASAPARGGATLATPQIYEITVASFRTAQRADQVADDLAGSGLPVSTRPDGAGEWYRVIVGPYPSSAEAEAARGALLLQGFSGTRITSSTPAR